MPTAEYIDPTVDLEPDQHLEAMQATHLEQLLVQETAQRVLVHSQPARRFGKRERQRELARKLRERGVRTAAALGK